MKTFHFASVILSFLVLSANANCQDSTLSAQFSDGVLTISGNGSDDLHNPLTIIVTSTAVTGFVQAPDEFSFEFRIDEHPTLNEVKVVSGAGADWLDIRLRNTALPNIDVTIESGMDDDQIYISSDDELLNHHGDLTINSGQGNDRIVFLDDTHIVGDTVIVTGQGRDRVDFGLAGWNSLGVANRFDGNVSISMGTHGDVVRFADVIVEITGDLLFDGGQGDDDFRVAAEYLGVSHIHILCVAGAVLFSGDQGFDSLLIDPEPTWPGVSLFEFGASEAVGFENIVMPE